MSPSSGQGDGEVEFAVAANPMPTMRQGELVINDNRVRLMQQAAPCRLSVDPERRTLDSDAATASFTIAANESCTWTARSNAGWLTLTDGASGTGNGTVSYRVSSNADDPRTGTVTIGDSTHVVIQQGRAPAPPTPPREPSCTYAIAPTSTTVGAGGGNGVVLVTVSTGTNCSWTAKSNTSWLSIRNGAAGSGNGSVGFASQPNAGGATRSGTLTIAGLAFTVSQPPAPPEPCTWGIDPSGASFPASGGSGSLVVSARSGCPWTASNTASWITFTSRYSGNATGRVDFLVLPNGGSARSGAIAVAGLSFSVSQDGSQ